jgi:hypothetical protein
MAISSVRAGSYGRSLGVEVRGFQFDQLSSIPSPIQGVRRSSSILHLVLDVDAKNFSARRASDPPISLSSSSSSTASTFDGARASSMSPFSHRPMEPLSELGPTLPPIVNRFPSQTHTYQSFFLIYLLVSHRILHLYLSLSLARYPLLRPPSQS